MRRTIGNTYGPERTGGGTYKGPLAYNDAGRYYLPGLFSNITPTMSTLALVDDTAYYVPFVAQGGGTIARISVYVTTGVDTTVVQLGLYKNKSRTDLYPGDALGISGNLSTGTAQNNTERSLTTGWEVAPGELLWLAVHADNGTPTIRALPDGSMYPIFGYDSTMADGTCGHMLTHAATTLADPATAGASIVEGVAPAIGVRFSA